MFRPEHRVSFQVLKKEVGMCSALRAMIPAVLKSRRTKYEAEKNADEVDKKKTAMKNNFKFLALIYGELQRRYGTPRGTELMRAILMNVAPGFFSGFTPLGPDDDLTDFIKVYKSFECHNLVFDVIEESKERFEIVVRRCLIYESFNELGMAHLAPCICDSAFTYFQSYHPRLKYMKDRVIAKGDDTCHEIFVWD